MAHDAFAHRPGFGMASTFLHAWLADNLGAATLAGLY